MTRLLEEIRGWKKKPKELLLYLSKLIKKDKTLLADLEKSLESATDSERGTCIEALEHVTQENPEYALSFLKIVISSLSDKAPRVKWEAARIIGNIASQYPEKSAQAVDSLLTNTKDKGTVVRWSAAFALGEILKGNFKLQTTLLPKVKKIIKAEENNGVKNVYLKALKVIGKDA